MQSTGLKFCMIRFHVHGKDRKIQQVDDFECEFNERSTRIAHNYNTAVKSTDIC